MPTLRAQLIKSATGVAGLKVINLGLVFISGVLLARILGPDSYGIYAFCVSLVTLLGLPTKAGLPTLILRETSLNQLQEKWGHLSGLLRVANIFVISYSFVVAILAYVIALQFSNRFQEESFNAFIFALLLLPIIAFGNVRGATLRGLRRVVHGQFPEDIVRPGMLVVLLLALQFFKVELNALVAIQLNVIACTIAFFVGAALLILALPTNVRNARPEYEYRAWIKSLIPLSIFAGLRLLDSQLNVLLIGTLASSEDVALFRVATQGAILVSFGLTAMNLTISPHVARLYKSGNLAAVQRLITKTTRIVFLVSIPIFLMYLFLSKQIVTFVFGESYGAAALPLIIICFGQFISCMCGSVALVLNMTGFEKDCVIGVVVAVFISVVLMIMLVPEYGATGGAIAYTSSLIVWNVILVFMTKYRTGIKTFVV